MISENPNSTRAKELDKRTELTMTYLLALAQGARVEEMPDGVPEETIGILEKLDDGALVMQVRHEYLDLDMIRYVSENTGGALEADASGKIKQLSKSPTSARL